MLYGQPVAKQEIDISRQTWFYEDPANDTLQTLASVRRQHFIPLSVTPHGELIKSTRIVWLRFQLVKPIRRTRYISDMSRVCTTSIRCMIPSV
ncbi:hypothetical protein GCM10028805_30110 [Spirosoma harenae]